MTRTCDTCGDELDADRDKSKGTYRDECLPCLTDRATLGDDSNPFRHLADAERKAGTLTTRVGGRE
jgi:hypothetical protein